MKRSWAGAILLILLLVGSLLVTGAMTDIHEPLEGSLQQAASCAMTGDWERAESLFRRCRDSWQRWEHFRCCFADHGPTEDIDAAFSALEVYAAAREKLSFASLCRSLARQVAAVGEAHRPVLWNLL